MSPAVVPRIAAVGIQWCPSTTLAGKDQIRFWSPAIFGSNNLQETGRSTAGDGCGFGEGSGASGGALVGEPAGRVLSGPVVWPPLPNGIARPDIAINATASLITFLSVQRLLRDAGWEPPVAALFQ